MLSVSATRSALSWYWGISNQLIYARLVWEQHRFQHGLLVFRLGPQLREGDLVGNNVPKSEVIFSESTISVSYKRHPPPAEGMRKRNDVRWKSSNSTPSIPSFSATTVEPPRPSQSTVSRKHGPKYSVCFI